MTQAELKTALEAAGLPVVYRAWPPKHAPQPPYLIFLRVRTANKFADGRVYRKIDHYQAELYSDEKAPDLESSVESALDAAGIPWEITAEEWIEEEGLYEILYEIEV